VGFPDLGVGVRLHTVPFGSILPSNPPVDRLEVLCGKFLDTGISSYGDEPANHLL
jgi:hypothetical protein